MWGWLVQQLLDPTHELLVLAHHLDWDAITTALRPYYRRLGRYAKPIRLMVGLHLLTHRLNLSDQQVVRGLHENRYWMALCGIDVGQVLEQAKPGAPCRFVDASTLPQWRKRLGPAGLHALAAVLFQQLVREHVVDGRGMVTDTTAQEKHIASPTDTALLDRGRRQLVQLLGRANAAGVAVAQGRRRFARTATRVVRAAFQPGRDRLERIEAANRQLAAMAQHVLRRVPRVVARLNGQVGALRRRGQAQAAAAVQRLREQLHGTAGLVRRIIHHNAERFRGRPVADQVLSLHEPHVVSICKGKRAKPTAYGCQVSVSIDRHGFVSTHTEYAHNSVDAETLPDAMAGWVRVFGQPPPELAGDRGFHHPEANRARLGTAEIPPLSLPRRGRTRHPDADTAWFKRLQRLRSQLEPVLSHLKADHRRDRCRYQGAAGDQLHVSWAVLAWNTKKWGRLLQQRLLVGQRVHRRAAYRSSLPPRTGFPNVVSHRGSSPRGPKNQDSHFSA